MSVILCVSDALADALFLITLFLVSPLAHPAGRDNPPSPSLYISSPSRKCGVCDGTVSCCCPKCDRQQHKSGPLSYGDVKDAARSLLHSPRLPAQTAPTTAIRDATCLVTYDSTCDMSSNFRAPRANAISDGTSIITHSRREYGGQFAHSRRGLWPST
jgi:hypothetical protein